VCHYDLAILTDGVGLSGQEYIKAVEYGRAEGRVAKEWGIRGKDAGRGVGYRAIHFDWRTRWR
jgi:hypothetical protein